MKSPGGKRSLGAFGALLVIGLLCGATFKECTPVTPAYQNPYQGHAYWFRGNIHTHTRLSDGGLTTREVAALYRNAGYHFIALTDHNRVNNEPAEGIVLLRGCESGDWWENHLNALGVARCPEECASCYWGWGLPTCSNAENQKRINQALEQGGFVMLNHPNETGPDCWIDEPIERGWPEHKLLGVKGFQAIEIMGAVDKWKFLLDRGRVVWAVMADDFHSGQPGTKGWVVVNSSRSPADAADILENLRRGNFYAVKNGGRDAQRTPAFRSIQTVGNIVSVSFTNASTIRFIDCRGILEEKFLPGDEGQEKSASYVPASGGLPVPRGYLRVEIEDANGNIAFSQPLAVIGDSPCASQIPPQTCSKTSCADLPCCAGYHCCGERCLPVSMQCP
ncbi:MAG: hypothetical protein WHT06_03530 [Desulfobacterales bacterium]